MPTKLAWITWVGEGDDGGAHPMPPIYYPPYPAHPIAPTPGHPIVLPPTEPGKPPIVIWPDPKPPYVDIGLPLPQPPYPPHPAHPIAPGGPPPWVSHPIPPIIWPEPPGGGPPIITDPGHPEHPIVLPPIDAHPEHPIVIPLPPEIWPSPGHPAHPIVIPPETPTDPERPMDWVVGWTEDTGWVLVGVPNFPVPTPSRAKPAAPPRK